MEARPQDQATLAPPPDAPEQQQQQQQQQQQPLSKNARKRILKQQRYEAKKAEKKAQLKEHKKREAERRRREWQEALESATEEERSKLIESRRERRRERVEKRSEERETKLRRLEAARASGQKVVIDLEFAHLMSANEINSLCQQIMYCYAMNGRCAYPCHLWLTGCRGEMGSQLRRIPGFDKWVVEMEDRSYVEALQDQKENLVYLTADSENVLDVLDQKRIYIIGGLVDRNRWKGLTMKKAEEQGIQTAKLPIGNYLKMSSSQVLTVNQVVEILLKFLETKDWKESFFHVIPQRKRCEADSIESQGNAEEEENVEDNQGEAKEEENVENNQSESNKERVEVPPPN